MGLNIVHFLARIVFKVLYFTKYVGKENVPQGGAVMCANHTGNLDPLFVLFDAKIGEFPYTIGKSELFKKKWMAKFFTWVHVFPVDRGKADLTAVRTSLKVLREGHKLVIFPEGRRIISPTGDEDVKSGAAMFAYKTNTPIVPMHITQGLKIPFRRITVVYGKPRNLDFGDKKPTQEDFARVMDEVFQEIRDMNPKKRKTA